MSLKKLPFLSRSGVYTEVNFSDSEGFVGFKEPQRPLGVIHFGMSKINFSY
jgi:hypothetical protein